MSTRHLTCTLCGFQFDPAEHPGCEACPVHSGCTTACCPNCGTTNINPQASGFARWVEKLFSKPIQARVPSTRMTLDQIPEGKMARIVGFEHMGAEQGKHLQAYGMLPGRAVRVLAHNPLTILQIEQTELALETSVAHSVVVDLEIRAQSDNPV